MMAMAPGSLPLTGERTVPGVPAENYWFRRHEAAYAYAVRFADGIRVLEVGCGEGYGTARLAAVASRVVGVDYDALTVEHARAAYPQVSFVRANLAALPFSAASFAAVATLQVIEHVWDHREFLTECLRVLEPGGVLLVTTPNRLTFSPGLEQPVNPFHTKEFTATELVELLETSGYEIVQVAGLFATARLQAMDRRHRGSFVAAQLDASPDDWSVALRSDVASVSIADFQIVSPGERRAVVLGAAGVDGTGVDGSAAGIDESLDIVVIARRPR